MKKIGNAAMDVRMVSVDAIHPYPGNPRRNKNGIDKVAASIKAFGFRQPIVVDEVGVVIAGHTRLEAARRLELQQVPVHVATGLSKAQVRAYRLADNRVAEESSWDDDLLAAEIVALQELDLDLSSTGFSVAELNRILSDGQQQGEDTLPRKPGKSRSKPGVVWGFRGGASRVLW